MEAEVGSMTSRHEQVEYDLAGNPMVGRLWDYKPEKPVASFPEYAYEPAGPVVVSVVRVRGEVWGYLWADDAADAADFLPARDAGEPAVNLSGWMERLRACKARGLKPSEALEELVAAGDFGDGVPGPIGAPVSYEQVQKLAGPPIWEDPDPPVGSTERRADDTQRRSR